MRHTVSKTDGSSQHIGRLYLSTTSGCFQRGDQQRNWYEHLKYSYVGFSCLLLIKVVSKDFECDFCALICILFCNRSILEYLIKLILTDCYRFCKFLYYFRNSVVANQSPSLICRFVFRLHRDLLLWQHCSGWDHAFPRLQPDLHLGPESCLHSGFPAGLPRTRNATDFRWRDLSRWPHVLSCYISAHWASSHWYLLQRRHRDHNSGPLQGPHVPAGAWGCDG